MKSDFDFGWKSWKTPPPYAELTWRHQKGDVLDVGCGTCQLLIYLREKGWKGRYQGIDREKYDGYAYPEGVELILGEASKVDFPAVHTVILYNVLEHVDDPVPIMRKSLAAARGNVLLCVPKRNEELWKHGLAEFHQLDKSHKHCGFSEEELKRFVELAGGKVATYQEINPISVMNFERFWKGQIPRFAMSILNAVFKSTEFYQEIWCEVIRG